MENKRPTLQVDEVPSKLPILIIDKKGNMGPKLAEMLQNQFLLVLVSLNKTQASEHLIHISYKKKIPLIPDNKYSHFFVFYNGEEEVLAMLPALVKKANQTQTKILFITSLPFSTPELFRRLSHHLYHDVAVLVYGEIFDPSLSENSLISYILKQAKRFHRIELPNEGLGQLYPVLQDDVFSAIISIAFGSDKKKKPVLIFPKHPLTELSIARMLQKRNPILRVDFKKYKGRMPLYYVPQDADYFYQDYPLEGKLHQVLGEYRLSKEMVPPKERVKPPHYYKSKMPIFWWVVFCLFIAPIIVVTVSSLVGLASLRLSLVQFERGNLVMAQDQARLATASLGVASSVGESLFYLEPVRGIKEAFLQKISLAKKLSDIEVDLLTAGVLIQHIQDQKSTNPKQDFQEAIVLVKRSLISLQKLRAEDQLPRALSVKLSQLEPALQPFENTLDVLPRLLGFEGKKKYLVLFQNNMELRPGGGFIGSYGILEIEKGRVGKFIVSDVYESDGKLTVHVEPPYGLRRYLGASHLFLRDSNYAIDFPTNASLANTFLRLETGQTVDGVVAVDTTFLKNLLTVIGPITVPEYKETITAENFYLRTQTHAEKDFFPGSTQKKDFLRALLDAIVAKLENERPNHQAMIEKIGEALGEKHLMMVVFDQPTQRLFTVNNLSAALWDGRGKEENTYLDFFGVVEANVGINKTNYYLKRSIEQQVVLDEKGTITNSVTITYTNTSKKNSQFGGDYKNYVRFVLPENVSIKEVRIDDEKQKTIDAITNPLQFTAPNFSPPSELEIESTQEKGKDVIGMLLLVPTQATKKITIVYESSNALSLEQATTDYSLQLFKQPGAANDSYSFSLSYPAGYQVVKKTPLLSDVGAKLLYSGLLAQDTELQAEFSKK